MMMQQLIMDDSPEERKDTYGAIIDEEEYEKQELEEVKNAESSIG